MSSIVPKEVFAQWHRDWLMVDCDLDEYFANRAAEWKGKQIYDYLIETGVLSTDGLHAKTILTLIYVDGVPDRGGESDGQG
jgi:hypothetical protein